LKEELKKIWEEYKREAKESKDSQELYRRKVWPMLLELWKTSPIVEPKAMDFDLSIHTLGTSPEATTLAILGTKSKEVYILHTPETKKYLQQIEEDVGLRVYPIEIKKDDVVAIYKRIEEILQRNEGKSVALDITSGTKAMSAGMASGGFFFRRFFEGVRVVYVDHEIYDAEMRRPVAGTEKLIILPSPHEVLGDIDGFFALEHYSKGEFYKAQTYLRNMENKTKDRRYATFADLCLMYHAWYALDFDTALERSKRILKDLRSDFWVGSPFIQNYEKIEFQKNALEAIKKLLDEKDFSNNKLGVLVLSKTLLRKGEKYEKDNELVLTALCTYRALELLLQERLSLYGLTPESKLSEEEKKAMQRLMAKILRTAETEVKIYEKLGLFDTIVLLLVKGDECVVKTFDEAKLSNFIFALQSRNSSILIHGLSFPSEKEIKYVRDSAEKLLEDLKARLRVGSDFEKKLERVNLSHEYFL